MTANCITCNAAISGTGNTVTRCEKCGREELRAAMVDSRLYFDGYCLTDGGGAERNLPHRKGWSPAPVKPAPKHPSLQRTWVEQGDRRYEAADAFGWPIVPRLAVTHPPEYIPGKRDYKALTEAAKRKPVGYVGKTVEPSENAMEVYTEMLKVRPITYGFAGSQSKDGSTAANDAKLTICGDIDPYGHVIYSSPHPLPPADGFSSETLREAASAPQEPADKPSPATPAQDSEWPKFCGSCNIPSDRMRTGVFVFNNEHDASTRYGLRGEVESSVHWQASFISEVVPRAEALAWLRAHRHAKAADEIEGKAPARRKA